MPRKAIQPPPRQGSLDRLMSSKSAVRARLGNDEKVSVDYIEACGRRSRHQTLTPHALRLACAAVACSMLTVRPASLCRSGDCFYMAVETALAESEGWQPWHAVAAMREVVASQLTEEIFQMYTLLHAQQADGGPLSRPTAVCAVTSPDSSRTQVSTGCEASTASRRCASASACAASRHGRPPPPLPLLTHHPSSSRTTGLALHHPKGVASLPRGALPYHLHVALTRADGP